MNEFQIIKKYFQQASALRDDVIVGSGDDCAVLLPPPGQDLLMSIDTLLAGRHFLPSIDPADLGYKSVAVSLSDIAAMAGQPAWLLVSLSLEKADESWLARFAEGILAAAKMAGVTLVGGDMTRGPLSVTTQLTGFVPKGEALLRSGARVGDKIFVTGTLGGAGLALADQLGQRSIDSAWLELVYTRLLRPTPRILEGVALRGLASAAIDISDGLLGDLGHILEQSKVGAQIVVDTLPLSPALRGLPHDEAWELALTAGDDYELCFTAPPEHEQMILAKMPPASAVTSIGRIVAESGAKVLRSSGRAYQCSGGAYQHFQ